MKVLEIDLAEADAGEAARRSRPEDRVGQVYAPGEPIVVLCLCCETVLVSPRYARGRRVCAWCLAHGSSSRREGGARCTTHRRREARDDQEK